MPPFATAHAFCQDRIGSVYLGMVPVNTIRFCAVYDHTGKVVFSKG